MGKSLFSIFSISLLIASVSVESLAAGLAPDVFSGGKYAKDYSGERVHVVINSDKTATFSYCDGAVPVTCRNLGNKSKYKLRDLQLRQSRLKKEAKFMIGTDAAVLLGAALAGTITALVSPTPVGPFAIGVYAASGAAGAGLLLFKGYLTPGGDNAIRRFNEADAVEKSLLSGEAVYVNEPVTEFAERLDAVLKGMI